MRGTPFVNLLWLPKRCPIAIMRRVAGAIHFRANHELRYRVYFPEREATGLSTLRMVRVCVNPMQVVIKQTAGRHYQSVFIFDLRQIAQVPSPWPVLRDHFEHNPPEIGVVCIIGERDVVVVIRLPRQITIY